MFYDILGVPRLASDSDLGVKRRANKNQCTIRHIFERRSILIVQRKLPRDS